MDMERVGTCEDSTAAAKQESRTTRPELVEQWRKYDKKPLTGAPVAVKQAGVAPPPPIIDGGARGHVKRLYAGLTGGVGYASFADLFRDEYLRAGVHFTRKCTNYF